MTSPVARPRRSFPAPHTARVLAIGTWACVLAGWFFAMSGITFVLWACAVVFAAKSVHEDRRRRNVALNAIGLLVGPGFLVLLYVMWFFNPPLMT